jgi:hypothetical protein
MSFIARISVKEGYLLGGTKVHVSSRMETRAMAENFADTTKEINERPDADVEIVESPNPPQIFEKEIS